MTTRADKHMHDEIREICQSQAYPNRSHNRKIALVLVACRKDKTYETYQEATCRAAKEKWRHESNVDEGPCHYA